MMIQKIAEVLKDSVLSRMFNFYIDETSFSDSLQKTNIKKNDTNVKNNYRPVSILPYFPKAF